MGKCTENCMRCKVQVVVVCSEVAVNNYQKWGADVGPG